VNAIGDAQHIQGWGFLNSTYRALVGATKTQTTYCNTHTKQSHRFLHSAQRHRWVDQHCRDLLQSHTIM